MQGVAETVCEQQVGMGIPEPGMGYRVPVLKRGLTRQRLLELNGIAKEIADLLDKKGVKESERCTFGELMQRMLPCE